MTNTPENTLQKIQQLQQFLEQLEKCTRTLTIQQLLQEHPNPRTRITILEPDKIQIPNPDPEHWMNNTHQEVRP